MRSKTIIAVILVILGIAVLAYSGIRYKTGGSPADIGPLYVETTESFFIPPVVAVALIGASCCLSWTPGRHERRNPRTVGGVTG